MIFYPWKSSDLALLKIIDWYNTRYQHIPFISLHTAVNHFTRKPNLLKVHYSSSHVWMWELDHKESRALKNWCFWNVVLEKTLNSPLEGKETKPVNLKGNQSWIFIGRTDAEDLATWCEELTHWKRPWCWGRLKAGGEGDDRKWDGCMASLIQ